MFAILFEVLLIEIQGGGVKGRKNCEQTFCEQTGVSYKWWPNPLVCVVQTPFLEGYQPVLRGFGASFHKMEGLDSKAPPVLHKACPL